MPIKYSIIMPYHRRAEQLQSTLLSFLYLYSHRKDFEVVVVEDYGNCSFLVYHQELVSVLRVFDKSLNIRHVIPTQDNNGSPAPLYNLGALNARGEYLVLTNPEGMHRSDILQGLDEEFEGNSDIYVVCSCLSVKATSLSLAQSQVTGGLWYQHSVFRDVGLHFCSSLPAKIYSWLQGFDEEYAKGYAFDDDDFRNKIIEALIPIVTRDDLATLHLRHDKSQPIDYLVRHAINKTYYEKKWGQGAFRAEQIPLTSR